MRLAGSGISGSPRVRVQSTLSSTLRRSALVARLSKPLTQCLELDGVEQLERDELLERALVAERVVKVERRQLVGCLTTAPGGPGRRVAVVNE